MKRLSNKGDCGIVLSAVIPSGWEEVSKMPFQSFLFTVMAGVAIHYICKWLDR